MIPIKRPTLTAPKKLSCSGGAHFLWHSVEGVLLSVPNVFQTELCLHLSCCVITSCCDKGRAWASSLARSLWFHCSLSCAFGDKRASFIASQPWFCVLRLSARCFTYQLFVILSSSFFHFLNSATSLNVLHLQIDHDDYWGGVFNHWVRKSCSGDTRIIKSLELVTHSLCGTWQLLK